MRKLLKYDLKAVMKYWWIGLVSVVGITLIGMLCCGFRISYTHDIVYENYGLMDSIRDNYLQPLSQVGVFLSLFGISLLPVFTVIMVLVRYYRNLFTEEGYLTFTLPVKRVNILNSKVWMAFIYSILTILSVIICLAAIFFTAFPILFSDYTLTEFFCKIGDVITELLRSIGIGYFILYACEAVAILLLAILTYILMFYFSTTVGSVIAKKHKVLAGIGILFAVRSIFSTLTTVFIVFINLLVMSWQYLEFQPFLACILFVVILFYVAVSALFYFWTLHMLKKKVNLA